MKKQLLRVNLTFLPLTGFTKFRVQFLAEKFGVPLLSALQGESEGETLDPQ